MLETIIIFALLSLPLSTPAIFALALTKPKSGRSALLLFYNPAAAIGFVLVAQILFFVLLTFGIYTYYKCQYGLLRSAACDGLDSSTSGLLFDTYFYGVVYLAWIGIPTVLVYIGAEILTRIRQKKSDRHA